MRYAPRLCRGGPRARATYGTRERKKTGKWNPLKKFHQPDDNTVDSTLHCLFPNHDEVT